jgi:ferredoxin--NADP+ reductase
MRLQDYDVATTFRATVLENRRITSTESPDEIREIVMDVDRPDFPYRVGQSIAVLAPGAKEFGKEHHVRLYSVADLPARSETGHPRITICVKRCNYTDEYSGEEFKGIASHYLCDLAPGAHLAIAGPFGLAFEVPEENDAHLVLIGTGTGIAPFRAFVKHIYRDRPDWKGKVWLFYGARSGLELLYMNDEKDDFGQYYDQETFQAFKALSARPAWSDAIAWDHVFAQRSDEIWEMLGSPKTYVYVAGLEKMREELDNVFAAVAGSRKAWDRRKAELMAGGRWVELVY